MTTSAVRGPGPAPVSVVVPTLGRPSLVSCMQSLSRCRPAPAEVLVTAQGEPKELAELVGRVGPPGTRVVEHRGHGVSSNTNLGVRLAAHPVVTVTHDDCTVQADWIGVAYELACRYPNAILTGRVLPSGDPARVPSCKTDPDSHDFTGELEPGALYPSNMVLPRDLVMASGGFDERFDPLGAAEDCDLAYRWLRAGLSLRYEPALVVHHHDWRTEEELARLYVDYGRGLGALYAKHLRAGDNAIFCFLARDVRLALVILRRRLLRVPSSLDWPSGLPAGLPRGLVFGLRRMGPGSPWDGTARAARPRSPA